MKRFYSFIVPVYNRPGELSELLETLAAQTYSGFEVVIIEDGSSIRSDHLVKEFSACLQIQYLDLLRSGPSLARNAGTRAAKGEY
ncbi:MAG: glycosyltransferase family A protein, partial [Bacteroidales bacterium]|nr:glycosyltransferase family A protein [Bacteroidales bacterium]